MPTGHMDGTREMCLLELVLLAYVDDHGPVSVAVLLELADVLGVDLLDLLLDLADDFCARCHYFTKCSAATTTAGAPFRTPRRKTQTYFFCGSPTQFLLLKPHQQFRLCAVLPIWGGDPICRFPPRSD